MLLSLTVAPVLCLLLFKNLKAGRDNFLVRWVKQGYLWQLNLCLNKRLATLAVLGLVVAVTLVALLVWEFAWRR